MHHRPDASAARLKRRRWPKAMPHDARRRWVAGVLTLGVLVALSSGLSRGAPARGEAQGQGPQVPVVAVEGRRAAAALELDGSLQAVRQSTLSAQASGRIASVMVKAGDRVRAGQVLAVIDDRSTQAGVAQAQAGVAQAQAQLTNAKAQFERARDLRTQGFVAQAALDTAAAQYKAAQAGLAAAQAGQAQSTLAQGFTRLTAPYDGWVLQTHAEAGSLAMPGSPVLTVYAPQPIRAVVHVPASGQGAAVKARQIEVQLPGTQSWVRPATQTHLPAADPISQTIEWRMELNAADGASQTPGRSVRVRFVAQDDASAQAMRLVVPAAAVLRRGEMTAVYAVAQRGTGPTEGFVLRAVRTGADRGDTVEILAGLKPGERVAIDPVRAGLSGAVPTTPPTAPVQ